MQEVGMQEVVMQEVGMQEVGMKDAPFVWNDLCSIAALVLTGLNQNQFFGLTHALKN
jgi:hypothetical protein